MAQTMEWYEVCFGENRCGRAMRQVLTTGGQHTCVPCFQTIKRPPLSRKCDELCRTQQQRYVQQPGGSIRKSRASRGRKSARAQERAHRLVCFGRRSSDVSIPPSSRLAASDHSAVSNIGQHRCAVRQTREHASSSSHAWEWLATSSPIGCSIIAPGLYPQLVAPFPAPIPRTVPCRGLASFRCIQDVATLGPRRDLTAVAAVKSKGSSGPL